MGCQQSKAAVSEHGSVASNSQPAALPTTTTTRSKKKKSSSNVSAGSSMVPVTRPRADSWALSQAQGRPLTHVETQWKTLWETQSPALLDPADVSAVLDQLMSRKINLLSTAEVNLISRKIRALILTPAPATHKLINMGNGAGGGGGGGNGSGGHVNAKQVLQQQHLLSFQVVTKLLPAASPVVDNFYTLLVHLSIKHGDNRVAQVAAHVAQMAHLSMDVNYWVRQQQPGNIAQMTPLPKPSLVPDLVDAPVVPSGVSLASLCFGVALGLRGTRTQQLCLLFYLHVDNLAAFLATHPAGGVPTWLLECGEHVVLSLASLVHYHYYGVQFLPCPTNMPALATLSSRPPLQISAAKLRDSIRTVLTLPPQPPNPTPDDSAHGGTLNGSVHDGNGPAAAISPVRSTSLHKRRRPSQSAPLVAGNSDADFFDNTSNHTTGHQPSNGGGISNSNVANDWNSSSELMRRIYADSLQDDEWITAILQKLDDADDRLIGMDEFIQWADFVFDEHCPTALLNLMHRFLGQGLLPRPELELAVVRDKWREWQSQLHRPFATEVAIGENALDELAQSVRNILDACRDSLILGSDAHTNGTTAPMNGHGNGVGQYFPSRKVSKAQHATIPTLPVWGGLGGLDGAGGIGHGVLYCVDKQWWDAWVSYTGWTWTGEGASRKKRKASRQRPGPISNENLLEHNDESYVPGIYGSYELMRRGLRRNDDYVLLPSSAWDTLYELYGGGPPLPRMVKPPQRKYSDSHHVSPDQSVDGDAEPPSLSGLNTVAGTRTLRLPEGLSVSTHPWMLDCHLCDPVQPYRRGEVGPLSIRIMVTPDQPVWRLFTEIVARFPLQAYKAFNADGKGKARLWKKMADNPPGQKDPTPRYGPWNLLCKGRHATIPNVANSVEVEAYMHEFVKEWKAYGDGSTIEAIGILDGDHLMFEFATMSKSNELVWPREAAAKAGRVRRLAEEDMEFRNLVQGVDSDGNALPIPPDLNGLEIDAMDSTGRWYPVTVEQVVVSDDNATGDNDGDSTTRSKGDGEESSRRTLKVDFGEHGGHIEWINVESDRLAKRGRFTSEADNPAGDPDGKGNQASAIDSKVKASSAPRRPSANETQAESTKVCPYPGFGACGLSNLGNTCYANSAIQCISYIPLLRAYLLNSQYRATNDLNRDNPLGTGGKLLEELADLLRVMWSGKYGERSPLKFRQQLGKLNAQFQGADQQDAQEFLNFLLDMLHEDSNRVQVKPYVEHAEDEWVRKTALSRVGEEAWRRFLRRNQSIMADVAMGQVLNTVVCPVCKYQSFSFDPFNLLSIPIPTVSDVMFQVTVIRRVTAFNAPWILNRPGKGSAEDTTHRHRFVRRLVGSNPSPPSDTCIAERYIIPMSRLADSSDLKGAIERVCKIESSALRLCRAEEIIVHKDADVSSAVKRQTKVIPLSEKEGPCSQLARKSNATETNPTHIIAYESTIRPRSMSKDQDDHPDDTADEEDDSQLEPMVGISSRDRHRIEKLLLSYGDDKECRMVDSDPITYAKAISCSLWPKTEADLKLGLRVDARDSRGNWYAGSVVGVAASEVGPIADSEGDMAEPIAVHRVQVRVHFDNFHPKWDEQYEIEHFRSGQVQPLYSHAAPRTKPVEFMVHHRYSTESYTVMFGQSFYLQCYNDWTNARAGAQILAQACRYLQAPSLDEDDPRVIRWYDKVHHILNDLIDLLIAGDREFVCSALDKDFSNPGLDVSAISEKLLAKAVPFLNRLPFEIRICTTETATSANSPGRDVDDWKLDFVLHRTIGNTLTARHAIVLQWKDYPLDRHSSSNLASYLKPSILYKAPSVTLHRSTQEWLPKRDKAMADAAASTTSKPGNAGLTLGSCLTEFCKQQELSENWRCPQCKETRVGQQHMKLWRLPDVLTFHIKRFNMSARWREKITTKVNFNLTGLDMQPWCHTEAPGNRGHDVYDLIGVVNHYGSMTGGHYVAMCKATPCGKEGREEVAHDFPGAHVFSDLELDVGADAGNNAGNSGGGWAGRLTRTKLEPHSNKALAKNVASSAEPLWLQFDDELVEPIPPHQIVSDSAYVLFYRRRNLTPANMAKYSTLE